MYCFPTGDPYTTAGLVRLLSLSLSCICICSQVAKVQADWCSWLASEKGRRSYNQHGASQERRGLDVSLRYSPYYTLCAQHTSAPPPSPGRETPEGVSVRP